MATATQTKPKPPGQAARAANKVTAKQAARSGTVATVAMPDARIFDRYGEFMADVATPIRLRILWGLSGGSVTVADLASALGKTSNTINNHLKALRTRELIEAAGEPRARTYSLTSEGTAWFKRLRPLCEVFTEG